jgi:hypothetical protein
MITKSIKLRDGVEIRVEYYPDIDAVYYSYIDHGDESMDTTDLIKLIGEEDPTRGVIGEIVVVIKILIKVLRWLRKINANKSN